jgi:hypothetical protein
MSDKADLLRQVNAVLEKLAKDDDLQDDFKLPVVKTAIDHWTGKNRLDPEKAQLLQNNRRVVYVLQRFQMLQSVCKEALMPVPLDHLLAGKKELDQSVVAQYFPNVKPVNTNPPKTPAATSENLKVPAPLKTTISATPSQEPAASLQPRKEKEQPSQNVPESSAPVSAEPVSTLASGMDVNSILKIAIAVVFVLIAVTLSQLLKR